MRTIVRLLLAAGIFIIAGTSAQAQNWVKYQVEGLPGIIPRTEIRAEIIKPDGSGPFPAIIVLHDCSGISKRDRKWGALLASWGYVAILPDSFGSRNHGSLCNNVEAVNADVRVQDVIATAEYLSGLFYVRKNFGVIGFSHGGWTIMKGVLETAYWSNYGIRAAVAYYPFCPVMNNNNKIVMPLKILIGDDDGITPASRCQTWLKEAQGNGHGMFTDLVVYPNTHHSFDGDGKVTTLSGQGAGGRTYSFKAGRNDDSAKKAEAATKEFFELYLSSKRNVTF